MRSTNLEMRQEILLALRFKGITQKKLARDLRVTESQLSNYFRNKADIKASLLLRIFEYLGMSPLERFMAVRKSNSAAVDRGLSETAIRVAQMLDALPKEDRKHLFQFVMRYHSAFFETESRVGT